MVGARVLLHGTTLSGSRIKTLQSPPEGNTMASLPDLSVQLYSVRKPLAEDFAATMSKLADIGLTRVEPYGMLDVADQLKKSLPDTGMTAPTVHQSLDGSDLDQIFETAADLRIDTVIHPYGPPERWRSRAEVQKLADVLNAAAHLASKYGVRVGYHNHDWEVSTQVDGRAGLEYFAELLDPAVRLEVDAYWAATGGSDVPALLERLGDRVTALHLKDGPLNGDTAAQLPLGSGDLPTPEIIAAATALQFPVLEFDDFRGDIFDGIRASYAYATSTLGAVR
jgi:sugar phosphate isomerase/epimerase